MKQIVKSCVIMLLLMSSCAGLFANGKATKIATQICAVIHNPTCYDVELWLKNDNDAVAYVESNHYHVQPGQTITCPISVENAEFVAKDLNQRLSCYTHPIRKPALSWTGSPEIRAETTIEDATSFITFDTKEKVVHLLLKAEHITNQEELWKVDPFDVIHVIKQ